MSDFVRIPLRVVPMVNWVFENFLKLFNKIIIGNFLKHTQK